MENFQAPEEETDDTREEDAAGAEGEEAETRQDEGGEAC